MPIKDPSPAPNKFPCRIGVDFWIKNHNVSSTGKQKRPSHVFYKYTDIPQESSEWIDPNMWLPEPFDLCVLKTCSNNKSGWWEGKEWDGLKIKSTDKVVSWKRFKDEVNDDDWKYY